MDSGQSIRIVNSGDRVFSFPYAGNIIEIPAGKDRFVPFDCMVAWMGHPNLRNTGYDLWRDEAYSNLCLFYGVTTVEGVDVDGLPKIEAWDMDGNRLSTVLDDPTGERIKVTAAPQTDTALMAAELARMRTALTTAGIDVDGGNEPDVSPVVLSPEAEIGNSKSPFGVDTGSNLGATGPVTDGLPPVDEPNQVKVGKR